VRGHPGLHVNLELTLQRESGDVIRPCDDRDPGAMETADELDHLRVRGGIASGGMCSRIAAKGSRLRIEIESGRFLRRQVEATTFGSVIDEHFTRKGDKAEWRSTSEKGRRNTHATDDRHRGRDPRRCIAETAIDRADGTGG